MKTPWVFLVAQWLKKKKSVCQCGGRRFSPWSGKIPLASDQLSQCAAATESKIEPGSRSHWSPCTRRPLSASGEAPRWEVPSHSWKVAPTHCPLRRWCHPAVSPSIIPSPPAPSPSRHHGLFQWVSSSHQVAKVLEFQPQHQSFQWTPRTDLL